MSKGGIYNGASVDQYSPTTMQTLKELMKEAHLSIFLQRNFEGKLRMGESLPESRPITTPSKNNQNLFDMKKKLHSTKRSKQQIEKTTALECGEFRPRSAFTDRAKDKEKLQNIMEFGDANVDQKPPRKPMQVRQLTKQERLNELEREIEERVQFLEEMKCLGEGKRYEHEIKQEISQKLSEVNYLQAMTDTDFAALKVPLSK